MLAARSCCALCPIWRDSGSARRATAAQRAATLPMRAIGRPTPTRSELSNVAELEVRVRFGTLRGLAAIAGVRGEAARAARLFGAAGGLRETVEGPIHGDDRPDHSRHEGIIAAVRSSLGEPAFAAAWEAGRAMTFEEAVAYALGHHGAGAEPVG